ncbi:MAG: carbohydrate-binding family 9-like protein [Sandaracinaceae bacterium]
MRRNTLLVCALATGLAVGCVERAAELSPADRERLREYVGTEAPHPQHELPVQFANGVSFLGYDVDGETAAVGQPLRITWYWHATQNMEEGWRLFTHVADASDASRFNQDGNGVVRELYQPSRWRAGEYINDVQEVSLPADWNSDRATFYLGIFNGPHRLAIRSGPNDGENRIRALSVSVTGATSAENDAPTGADAPPPPSLRAGRVEGELTIDGELTEPAWAHAQRTRAFVNTLNGSGQAAPETTARVLWDDSNLYVAFDVADDYLHNPLEGDDPHLWEQDAVEIMIDPGDDGRNYFEFQASPTGEVFDTRYDTRRQPQPFGHLDWDSHARVAVKAEGTVNDEATDHGYHVEVAIPWSAFDTGEPPAARPAANQAWRMNFYVMDARPNGQAQRSAGWSPTLTNDFHVPDRFGRVIFGAPMIAAQEAQGPDTAGENGEPPTVGTRVLPLPPGAAAAVRDTLRGATVVDPRGSAVVSPQDRAALEEASQLRRAQRQAAREEEEPLPE